MLFRSRDGITDGLVCVFSTLEPCRRFSLRFTTGQPYVQSAKRKCLHLYYYFMDRDLGPIHVRVPTTRRRPVRKWAAASGGCMHMG